MAVTPSIALSGLVRLVLHWKINWRNCEFNLAFNPLFSVYLARQVLRKGRFQLRLEGKTECEGLRKHGINESLGSSTIFGKILLEEAQVLALSFVACVSHPGDFDHSGRIVGIGSFSISVLGSEERKAF